MNDKGIFIDSYLINSHKKKDKLNKLNSSEHRQAQ